MTMIIFLKSQQGSLEVRVHLWRQETKRFEQWLVFRMLCGHIFHDDLGRRLHKLASIILRDRATRLMKLATPILAYYLPLDLLDSTVSPHQFNYYPQYRIYIKLTALRSTHDQLIISIKDSQKWKDIMNTEDTIQPQNPSFIMIDGHSSLQLLFSLEVRHILYTLAFKLPNYKYKESINKMSKTLQALKPEVTRARNQALFGMYSQSVTNYNEIISKITSQLGNINDRNLIAEWNKLLDSIRSERESANNMKQILCGNVPTKETRKQQPRIREDHSQSEIKFAKRGIEDHHDEKRQSFQGNMKKNVHEDDQLYNRKEKEARDQERIESEKEQQKRLYEERNQEIFPTKKPVLTDKRKKGTKTPSSQPSNNAANNNSGMVKGNRQYDKPWTENARNPNSKAANTEERKTFLKSCYPDGNGPDSNLIEMLEKEVISFNPDVTFEDIAELEKAKDVLEEAVLLPLLMPHLFKGIRRAWKGVLLFGPPGTGKTLLAKAIASGGKTTFFNVTASSLASKWKGDSEKLVRILFEMAKFYAPTTIFIDEIDSLASKRGEKEDESSRKVKTELMTRIDGVSSGEEGKSIVVIGATNRPWDLDEAIRRRLEKRIYIPLPTEIGRREMLRINLKQVQLEASVDLQEIVKKSDGYSGADIALLCREAAMMPMRRKLKREGGLGKKMNNLQWMKQFEKDVTVPLAMQDFIEALKNVKPSVGKNDLVEYEKWMTEFGEQGTN